MKRLALVVAVSDDGVIGLRGALPWRIPEDLKHFRAVTMGHAIVMGRLTYESIGKPLPGRRNLVVSRGALPIEGCEVATSLQAALELAWASDEEPCVIGGAQLYEAALPLATTIHLTEVHRAVEGDTYLRLDRTGWREIERRAAETADVEFVTLVRP